MNSFNKSSSVNRKYRAKVHVCIVSTQYKDIKDRIRINNQLSISLFIVSQTLETVECEEVTRIL